MAGRQTEACERGQVPALQLRAADPVAAPGTRGGTGVHAPGRAGQGRFLPPQERGRAKLGCDTGWHAACTPYKSRWLQHVFSFFPFFFLQQDSRSLPCSRMPSTQLRPGRVQPEPCQVLLPAPNSL